MEIFLVKSGLNEAATIHEMQIKAFMPLFDKYQDFETSPAKESVERIKNRMNQSFTDYYIIKSSNISLGAVRIVRKENKTYRVSPIFVLLNIKGKELLKQYLQ